MGIKEAKIIAETISNEDLLIMITNAKEGIRHWNVRSSINNGMSIGVSWNILAKDFDVSLTYHQIVKKNLLREFGDYLPIELRIKRDSKKPKQSFVHQEPDFSRW